MKKLFTLFWGLVTTLGIQSQTTFPVQFADKDGNLIEDGTTINFTEYEMDVFGTIQMPTKLYVKNQTTEEVQIGGIYTMAQTVTANGLTVTNCSSQAQGGGVYLYPKSSSDPRSVTITDSTIQNNGAIGNGGGLYYDCGSGTLAFTGCSSLETVWLPMLNMDVI